MAHSRKLESSPSTSSRLEKTIKTLELQKKAEGRVNPNDQRIVQPSPGVNHIMIASVLLTIHSAVNNPGALLFVVQRIGKFCPFSLLMNLGSYCMFADSSKIADSIATPSSRFAMDQFNRHFKLACLSVRSCPFRTIVDRATLVWVGLWLGADSERFW